MVWCDAVWKGVGWCGAVRCEAVRIGAGWMGGIGCGQGQLLAEEALAAVISYGVSG